MSCMKVFHQYETIITAYTESSAAIISHTTIPNAHFDRFRNLLLLFFWLGENFASLLFDDVTDPFVAVFVRNMLEQPEVESSCGAFMSDFICHGFAFRILRAVPRHKSAVITNDAFLEPLSALDIQSLHEEAECLLKIVKVNVGATSSLGLRPHIGIGLFEVESDGFRDVFVDSLREGGQRCYFCG